MLDYFIKVLIFQTLFLAIYDLFLKRETFFQWNRIYLILTSILAYVIPLLKVNRIRDIVPQEYIVLLPEVVLSPTVTIERKLQEPQVVFNVVQFIFWIGILLSVSFFLLKLFRIILLIYKYEKERKGNYYLVYLKNSSAFSFFNYIFIGKAISGKSKLQVIEHELIHVQQKHSVDLILFEFQKIVCWFNPFSYLFQHRISELHEFIADSKAIKEKDKTTYFNKLLAENFGVQNISFINPFFKHSLIKKRIVMLHKKRSKQVLTLKYILLIPVIVSIFVIATNIEAQEIETAHKKEKTYKLSLVKTSPVYPSCKNLKTQFEIRKCLSESITEHFKDNFDFTLLKKLDEQTDKRFVSTFFVIDKKGKISSPYAFARPRNKKLEKEAIRVVNLLPRMTPGIRKGWSVGVTYSVSIQYSEGEIKIKSESGPY